MPLGQAGRLCAVVWGSHSGDRGEGRDHPSRPSLPGDRRTTAAPHGRPGERKETHHTNPRRASKTCTTLKILGSGAGGVNYTAIIFGAGRAKVQQISPSHRQGKRGN